MVGERRIDDEETQDEYTDGKARVDRKRRKIEPRKQPPRSIPGRENENSVTPTDRYKLSIDSFCFELLKILVLICLKLTTRIA